uniref:Gustatory receptor n=1 Tax=Culicoides sonorensis TaxID=179676 RepID=A0A336M483_CULSO
MGRKHGRRMFLKFLNTHKNGRTRTQTRCFEEDRRRCSQAEMIERRLSDAWENINSKENVNFHRAIRWTLCIMTILSVFPVNGIMSKSASGLSYSRKSFRFIISLIVVLFGFLELILTIRLAIKLGFDIKSISNIVSWMTSLYAAIALRRLAKSWPRLMQNFSVKEEIFLKYPYMPPKWSITISMTFLAIFMFLMVTVERVLFYTKVVYESNVNYNFCNATVPFAEHFFKRQRPHFFDLIDYHPWLQPIIEWAHFSMNSCWAFVDVIIINISIALTARFNQLNERIISEYQRTMNPDQWSQLRGHYQILADLVAEVDLYVSNLILISCGNNLYFISYYIFKSFTMFHDSYRPDMTYRIHLWFSISLLIVRAASVLLIASNINDASRKSVNTIRRLPTKFWNIEVQRFVDEIEMRKVALTGKNIFKLTRKLILAFSGTIVTFEIALLDRVRYDESKRLKCEIAF